MNVSKHFQDSAGIGFGIGVLLIVSLPVLIGTGTIHRLVALVQPADTTRPNMSIGNPAYTPPQSTSGLISAGPYTGWTEYHHNMLNFTVNIPHGLTIDELPQTRAEQPRYPEFVLQLSSKVGTNQIEFARVTVYDSAMPVNTRAQDAATDDPFTVAPTKQTGALKGHKSVQYFYQNDVRTVVYLIDDGTRTFEIRGSTDATKPADVAAYWDSFNQLLNSFVIN